MLLPGSDSHPANKTTSAPLISGGGIGRRIGESPHRPDEIPMRAVVRYEGGNCIVCVSGKIIIDSSPELHRVLFQQLATTQCESLTVNLHDVTYVDTSCLAVLLEALRAARRRNKQFHLSGLRGQPLFLLESTGLLHMFDEFAGGIVSDETPKPGETGIQDSPLPGRLQ
jgi:anti-sigma B factor antagonist